MTALTAAAPLVAAAAIGGLVLVGVYLFALEVWTARRGD
jgi:hypothetical protein